MTGETLKCAMTRLMQDDQVIRASQHLVKKLSQDVKTMMIYRQNTTIGRDQFSKLIYRVFFRGESEATYGAFSVIE